MSEEAAMSFARKMRISAALMWFGLALFILSAALIFVLRPLSDNIGLITAICLVGMTFLAISSMARLLSNCPKCGNRFCGTEETGQNVFASKCRSCGYKTKD
jgi:hypothetical protein